MNILDTLKQIKAALPTDTCRQVFDALEQTGIRTIKNYNVFDRAVDELCYAAQDLSAQIGFPWQEVAIAMMMSLVEDIEDETLSNGKECGELLQSDGLLQRNILAAQIEALLAGREIISLSLRLREEDAKQEQEVVSIPINVTLQTTGITIEVIDAQGVELAAIVLELYRANGTDQPPVLYLLSWDHEQLGHDPSTRVLATEVQLRGSEPRRANDEALPKPGPKGDKLTVYDYITDQFSPGLSRLAKQLYAAIFDACSDLRLVGYIASWDLAKLVAEADGIDSVFPSPGEDAKRELLNAGLIQEVSNLDCRYQPIGRAWALHLDAVRQRASI